MVMEKSFQEKNRSSAYLERQEFRLQSLKSRMPPEQHNRHAGQLGSEF
jgi:hypothetical protein